MAKRLALLMAAISLSGATKPPANTDNIPGFFARWNSPSSPGCAVAVGQRGVVQFTGFYGSADLEHSVPIDHTTRFEAGSVSKQFTAAAILLLADEHRLKLSDDIRRYIPELPNYHQTITIDHLLTHTSGLRDWGEIVQIAGWPRTTRTYTQADVLKIAGRQRNLNHAPGDTFSYTNTGYNLLAMVVERITGSSLQNFTQERFFGPLGMNQTSWRDDFRRLVKNRAQAYSRRGPDYIGLMPFESDYGNAGLITTPEDLLAWNEALASGRLGPFITQKLHETATLTSGRHVTYSRGLYVEPFENDVLISHGGSSGGYRAWLGRLSDQGTSIALLCNSFDINATTIGRQIAAKYLPSASKPPGPAFVQSVERAGLFLNKSTGLLTRIVADEGRLRLANGPFLDAISQDSLRIGSNQFFYSGPDLSRVVSAEGQEFLFKHVIPETSNQAQLGEFAGNYFSSEAGGSYIVTVENNLLIMQSGDRPTLKFVLKPAYRDTFEFDDGIVRFQRGGRRIPRVLSVSTERVWSIPFYREK